MQKLGTKLGGIDQGPIVRKGEWAVHGFNQERLGIARGGRTHGRVAGVPDCLITGERGEGFRGENLGEQADILVDPRALTVGDRNARRFLTAMLQGEEPEEGQLGRFFAAGRGYGDHPAFFARSVVAKRGDEFGGVLHDARAANTPLRKSGSACPRF